MAGCEGLSHTAARKKWRLGGGGKDGRAVKREMLADEMVLAQNVSLHQLCQRPEMHLKSIY